MAAGYAIQFALAVLLNLGVIFALVRGPLRRFPIVLFFCILQIVFAVGSNVLYFYVGSHSAFSRWYWTGDMVGHACISLIIISMIREALAGQPSRRQVPPLLIAGMIAVALVSLVLFYSPQLNKWITPVSRNLSFGEEVLNLVLWSLLLQRSDFDSQFLIVSAGIGIQVTGEVVGHTLRLYTTKSTIWVPTLLNTVCEIVCLMVLIWAFTSAPGKSRALAASNQA